MNPSTAKALVALSGRSFVPLALLAKLPLAMGQLGLLLLVADRTGSYASGGLTAAFVGLGSAVGAPLAGAAADRVGQRWVVVGCGAGYAAGMLAVLGLVQAGAGLAVLLPAAAVAGAFAPQVGPLARVRWVALVRRGCPEQSQRQRVSEAFALEGATDEFGFVAGPALVGVLATLAGPAWVPVVIAVLSLTAVMAFALHPTERAVVRSHAPHPSRPGSTPDVARGLPGGSTTALLLLGGVLLGLVFGGTQVGVTSLAASLGHAGAAGLVYGLLGLGSALAGLASAGLPPTFGLSSRLVAFAAALAVLSLPLLLAGSMAGLAVAVALVGLAVAPYLIVLYALAERVAPVERVATVMTLLASAVIVGYAIGSSTAGALADAAGDGSGHRAAFAVPVAAGAGALALALLARARFRRL